MFGAKKVNFRGMVKAELFTDRKSLSVAQPLAKAPNVNIVCLSRYILEIKK